MRYSPESLEAFVQTVESGSFSAAARALRKSQSTISTAVANLEQDLGFTLFSRESRNPVLTENGQRALAQVKEILAASAQLDELAIRLAGRWNRACGWQSPISGRRITMNHCCSASPHATLTLNSNA